MDRRTKPYFVLAASIILIGIVPVLNQHDSFPISTYPMFSSRRTTTESVDTAVFMDLMGKVQRLTPSVIAGTDEVILAAQTVSHAISDGTTKELCAEIAARYTPKVAGRIEVVTEVFDALQWYDGNKSPLRRTVHASCEEHP